MAGLGKLGASMAAAIASRGFDVVGECGAFSVEYAPEAFAEIGRALARATCAVYGEILDRLQLAPWRAVEASAV